MTILVENEPIKTLMFLGLNFSQAKVYLSLVQKGTSTAKQISKFSGVNRQEIYRIMPKLQKLGLAEKVLALPTRWKTIPIEDGLSILLELKKKELSELQKKATKIINFQNENNEKTELEEEQQFGIISPKEVVRRWIPRRLEDTQVSNDVITELKTFNKIMYFNGDCFRKVLNRGVKLRFIIYKSENEKLVPKIDLKLNDMSNMKIKYLRGNPPSILVIQDNKTAILNTVSNSPNPSPSFVTSNPVLLGIFRNYFETSWKRAKNAM
jgi:sugar-specific transcriptional regulator TrmB